MSGLRSWFRGTPTKSDDPSPAGSSTAVNGVLSPAEREIADINDAMEAAGLIMNDNIEGAEVRLRLHADTSSFHQLGLGIATFMRSILGLEKDIMAEAARVLGDCETRSWNEMKKAQRETAGGWFSRGTASANTDDRIYPAGSEYALVNAQAQLMGAMVSVMHESITDAIKGFYKLRKAFLTLDGLMRSEDKVLGRQAGSVNGSLRRPSVASERMPGSFDGMDFEDLVEEQKKEQKDVDEEDMDFVDAKEDISGAQTPQVYEGHVAKDGQESTPKPPTPSQELEKPMADLELVESPVQDQQINSRPDSVSQPPISPLKPAVPAPSSSEFTHPLDIFVHSGANMCFGILLLMISMVPPSFSRILYIIGFKGDRNRGIQMLWQSTKFANINGGVAGLVLLSYYNGLMAFADILPQPDDIESLADPGEIVGHPVERCDALQQTMRERYPDSLLWLLEKARALANSRRLPESIKILKEGGDSRMRQVTALSKFELSLNAMYAMDWPLMCDSFTKIVDLSDWSHTLYYYLAACAEIEMYRDAFHLVKMLEGNENKLRDKEQAEAARERHRKAAEEFLRKAPKTAGKRRFMARQMPLEVYALRKLNKWEERTKELGVDLLDAVGVSPAEEMVYIWNGYKRRNHEMLEKATQLLHWERCTTTPENIEKIRTIVDEASIKALCEVASLRNRGRYPEAKEILEAEVLVHDRAAFKGPTKDDWVLPAASYEAACIAWNAACDPECFPSDPEQVEDHRREKTIETYAQLDKIAKWEAFILDARLGLRVQAGLDTVKWLKLKKKWT